MRRVLATVALSLLPISAVGFYFATAVVETQASASDLSAYHEIDWRLLRQLDLDTGAAPDELRALDGALVKIAGFVVPLDDDTDAASEFLLVPTPQACIHVPPPPANQMLMIRMQGRAPQRSWGPVWVAGRLTVAAQTSQYGKISFQMQGDAAEPYRQSE